MAGPQDPHLGLGWSRLWTESPRPHFVKEHPNAIWLVVATVCIGAFMGQLDASIVTLAFPTLGRDFQASVGDVAWVGLSYLLVLVATVAAVGRVADMVGRKLLYVYGFIVFVVGSGLCGLAPNLIWLDVFRAIQALGAAMLQANSVAIIADAVPRHRLGQAIGIQGAAQALGLSLGPVVGGLLIALGGWRLIFLVNVPVGIVGTVLGWLLIPRSRRLQTRTAFDWPGLVLFVPAIASLLVALSYGNQLGWTSPIVLALGGGVAVLGILFLRRQARVRHPMIDLSLFRRPAFATGISSGLLSYLVLFGTLFIVPYYLETVRHLSVGHTGLELTVMPVAIGLVAPFAGRSADRIGSRPLTVAGMAMAGTSFVMMALFHATTLAFILELAGLGAGLGAFTPANNASIMAAAPRAQSGLAGGMLNMTRALGTALGLAMSGLILASVAGAQARSPSLINQGFVVATLSFGAACGLAGLLSSRQARGTNNTARLLN